MKIRGIGEKDKPGRVRLRPQNNPRTGLPVQTGSGRPWASSCHLVTSPSASVCCAGAEPTAALSPWTAAGTRKLKGIEQEIEVYSLVPANPRGTS